ncbi:MAG: ATP-dependent Clp protease ATP-binding subunit [Spirochaetales bacterium]|nr:ATP-dependent Clp protease ATP-binding subunit [Spirochaetales bacterium]
MLDSFARDLVLMASSGQLDPIVGRETEINRLMHILARRRKNNPVLIGEPGVGKTAIVEGFAHRIAQGTAPEVFLDKRIMVIDMGSLVAGTKFRGEFEERLKNLVKEVESVKNVILFIDEIHTIVGAGGSEGAVDAANILKPALARGTFQCIGATTMDEYRKHIEKDAALERRFQTVLVEEPDREHTLEILKGLRTNYENFHNVSFSDEALEAAVDLSSRYITSRMQPDKAIDLLDESGAHCRIAFVEKPAEMLNIEDKIQRLTDTKKHFVQVQAYEEAAKIRDEINKLKYTLDMMGQEWRASLKKNRNIIDVEDICRTLSSMTGIPVSGISRNETEKLLKMEEYLHKYVVAQDDAIKAVSAAIRRSRAGIASPKRPLGSFIFLGPTGVGKTYLAKQLAQYLFGSEDALIRVDMSDYREKHTTSRLVGSPPGYVGYGEGGWLTEKVRRKPYCVILFDEIEKAHPDVFNLLLQMLEEGEIQDSLGHRVSFRNAIIIMTSNAGTREFASDSMVGFRREEESESRSTIRSAALNELKRSFRPEFLNRIDEIVVFDLLKPEEIEAIFDLMISELSQRLKEKGITLSLSKKAKKYFIEKGFDAKFGARPMRSLIQKELEDEIALKLINGELVSGSTVVFSEPCRGKAFSHLRCCCKQPASRK